MLSTGLTVQGEGGGHFNPGPTFELMARLVPSAPATSQALSLLRATAASTLRLTVASCSTAIAAADSSESAWRWALLLLLEACHLGLSF